VEKQRPILVVNAAPPSPHATSEMLLLEGVPHQVLEGILLAVNTLQAEAVIVYLPAEATLARDACAIVGKAAPEHHPRRLISRHLRSSPANLAFGGR
jgi:NADH:ubiquinone oxidoreductase subunit F (NADH-binding)